MKRGDIVSLGPHRLMCGDAQDAHDIMRLLDGQRPDCLLTSPPYLNMRVYGSKKNPVQDWEGLVTNACCRTPTLPYTQMFVVLGLVHNGGEWSDYWTTWLRNMKRHGWRRFGLYVWNRQYHTPGNWNGRLPTQAEFIFHLNRKSLPTTKSVPCRTKPGVMGGDSKGTTTKRDGSLRKPWKWNSDENRFKTQGGVISCNPVQFREYSHPAQMPHELSEKIIAAWKWPDSPLIYDPFAGSGNVCVAADRSRARALMMEIEPEYCEMAVERYRKHKEKKQ